MIGLIGLFFNISTSKIELEKIIVTIETSENHKDSANRLNDRNNVSIIEHDVGDKVQYYVELTSSYRIIDMDLKNFKLKGYTKVLEV